MSDWIKCSCGVEAIEVSMLDDENDAVYMEWWQQLPGSPTLWKRIKGALCILRGGNVSAGEIVLTKKGLLKFIRILTKYYGVMKHETGQIPRPVPPRYGDAT